MGSALEEFRAGFDGEALLPGDAAYDEARSVWNGNIDRRPALIARCGAPMHVAEAIALARREGLELSVRGGGHNFAGSAVCDDGLMIDLSTMNDVTVDADARRARCGGGATWADLDGATQQHGLAVTGGFISHTGVGGLTLGGGMGWLTRKAGLSCDNLVSAEVVLADGQVVRASADEHENLFWAIRGGGGNFGVVTEFEFALHEVGPLVQLGLFFWGADQGVEALRVSRDIVAGLPEGVGALIAGLSAPPAPFVPQEHQLAPGFALLIGSFGSPEEHAEIVAPVREALAPLFELVTPIPYTQLQKMFDEGNAWGTHAYEKALYLDELSDEVIAIFADQLPRKASPLSFVPVFPLDGAYTDVGEDDTAFGGSRSARFVFNIAAICPVPELLEADRAWVRGFWEALRPHASGSGSYVNFMTDIEEDRVRAAYGAVKYDRLSRIKADYDPDNVFHLNANIKPLVPTA
jgi:FAD binding domain-containing protein/berberine-like enzyme